VASAGSRSTAAIRSACESSINPLPSNSLRRSSRSGE
jgi:hypothetical protein